MSDPVVASIREALWHKMRHDLAKYVPEIIGNQLLMCCGCGHFLPQEGFALVQALAVRGRLRFPAWRGGPKLST